MPRIRCLVGGGPLRLVVVLLGAGLLLASLGSPLGGQEETETRTYARRGLLVGAVSGGLAGGLALGTLSNALCEGGCSDSFRDGFTLGAVGGVVLGGLSGLVIGAAVPRPSGEGEHAPRGPWNLRLGGGPRWAGSGEVKGLGIWVGLSALRPTSPRVRWGFEMGYLGRGESRSSFTTSNRDESSTTVETRTRRTLWNLSLIAIRVLGSTPEEGTYLLADAGVFPLSEALRSNRRTTWPPPTVPLLPTVPSEISERRLEYLPGVGIGIGGIKVVDERFGVGLESRCRVILGSDNEPFLPVLSVGINLVH